MAKIVMIWVLSVLVYAYGQRITTIHLDGVQYFISRMNPYSPELNYFLAYQYCRSLGLQLASFETREKTESMTTYLKNAGYGNYDFWTSGNRLGTGMFLWMSTGLPFNATFDFFESSVDTTPSGQLDAMDHSSNTAPQRTARDSSSGADKGCVILKQPSLKWVPEDCSSVKDFICEQTRCYYYNYGSIPVSSAQGRPITTTTPRIIASLINLYSSTTSIPVTSSSPKDLNGDEIQEEIDTSILGKEVGLEQSVVTKIFDGNMGNIKNFTMQKTISKLNNMEPIDIIHLNTFENNTLLFNKFNNRSEALDKNLSVAVNGEEPTENIDVTLNANHKKFGNKFLKHFDNQPVEARLKKISAEIEKFSDDHRDINVYNSNLKQQNDWFDRQSFLSLTDLIKTLHPNDKHVIPQIDSDYSNAKRVLGESS